MRTRRFSMTIATGMMNSTNMTTLREYIRTSINILPRNTNMIICRISIIGMDTKNKNLFKEQSMPTSPNNQHLPFGENKHAEWYGKDILSVKQFSRADLEYVFGVAHEMRGMVER